MGCVSSKDALPVTPTMDSRVQRGHRDRPEPLLASVAYRTGEGFLDKDEVLTAVEEEGEEIGSWMTMEESSKNASSRLGNLHKYIEGEQAAAGWPSWLTAVAKEAIHGWVPLKAESFEKLEKIGQGTYSNVFRARNLDTGKIYALKKVRFDNFEPESVRFMAREIQILRGLDHPNVIQLEGLIASRLSSSLYLVFEYMEHDLAGLASSPDIKFSESQIKCYLRQLLSGIEHCHKRGIMHRDIKGANLLVNNEGILKVADFGLANVYVPDQKQPLTSRVVTLWYRPPELLLGSTDYETTVDLWSIGCVFAEMYTCKPILQGRTEVEQLHKIFKLCGSPPDEYWKTSKLPNATIFKPHRPYESCIRATFQNLPESAVDLLKTLLSVEPYKRGTASTALTSEYFQVAPLPCDPSSLPKYPPNKEIDAKYRDEIQRGNVPSIRRVIEATRPLREHRGAIQPTEIKKTSEKQETIPKSRLQDGHHKRHNSQGISFTGPLRVSTSGAVISAKRPQEDHANGTGYNRSLSKFNLSGVLDSSDDVTSKGKENGEKGGDMHEVEKNAAPKKWERSAYPDSFKGEEKIEYSGPLLFQPHKVDELLQKNERHVRQAIRRSWFQKVTGRKQGK